MLTEIPLLNTLKIEIQKKHSDKKNSFSITA